MKDKRTMTDEQIQSFAKQIADKVREMLRDDQYPIEHLIHGVVLVKLWEGHPKNPFAKETIYKGYQPVKMEPGDWKFKSKQAWNKKDITFPKCEDPTDIRGREITYWSIESETGITLYWGKLTDSLWVNGIITPAFSKKDLTIVEK
jgi:hypothetical protein